MHIAHLTTVHPPFDSRVFHKECVGLADAGFEVTLLAPHTKSERVDGVDIIALPRHGHRITRILLGSVDAFRAIRRVPADVYHFHDPELIPTALLLQRLGRKFVYDVHEDVPMDLLNKAYLPPTAAQLLSRFMKLMHSIADKHLSGVVVVTPAIAAGFTHPVLVRNFPVTQEFSHAGRSYIDRPKTCAYVGAIGSQRGTRQMMEAAEILAATNDCPTLILAGPHRNEELRSTIEGLAADHAVRYVGELDRTGVAELLGSTRAGLVVPPPDNLGYQTAYPIKLFEYMAAGIPVVSSNFPVYREFVDSSRCGLTVDPEKPEEIAAAVQWIFDNPHEAEAMGQRGREAVLSRYNWASELRSLADLYRGLATSA